MPWFKVDDGFYSSRKVLSIPRAQRAAAIGLWTLAGSWSARELTDGAIPAYVLDEIGATPKLSQALINARLWLDRGEAGVEFTNWAEYQPTRAEVEAERQKARERLRKWRSKRSGNGDETPLQTVYERRGSGVSNGNPDPTRPDPSISNEIEEPLSDADAPNGTLIPDEWRPNQTHIDKAASLHLDVKREYQRFRQSAETKHRRLKNWNTGFTNWLRKAAEFNQQRQGIAPVTSKPSPADRAATTIAIGRSLDQLEIE